MSAITTHEEYVAAKGAAREASLAHYGSDADGTVKMSNDVYDVLMVNLAQAEADHPEWAAGDATSDQVAAGAAVDGDVPHSRPMLSLTNVFSPDELTAWVKRYDVEGALAIEGKMDGLALCLRYRDGKLVQAITRGDGTKGEDVSSAISSLANVPTEGVFYSDPSCGGGEVSTRDICRKPFTGEVRGEAIFSREQFARAQEIRANHGRPPFDNARNGVAGAVRGAKDRAYLVPFSFMAYDLVGDGYGIAPTHEAAMRLVENMGFSTARQVFPGTSKRMFLTEAIEAVEAFEGKRKSYPFEMDGIVIKVNSLAERERIGAGSKAPRWAVAYKFDPDVAMTVLRNVTWETGRTGVVAPRAEFDTVRLVTKVSFATLNNPDDIARKGVMIGDHIMVRKAGDVIPEIVTAIPEMRDGSQTPIDIPTTCPNCGRTLDTSQARLRCPSGGACAIMPKIEYAASRDGFNIDGFGPSMARPLVASGRVTSIADLFTLTVDEIAALPTPKTYDDTPANRKAGIVGRDVPVGTTKAAKVVANIEAAKAAPLARVITALGLAMTGVSMSARIAKHFGSMDALRAATTDDIAMVKGLGDVKSNSIHDELVAMADVLDALAACGVRTANDPLPVRGESEGTVTLGGSPQGTYLAGGDGFRIAGAEAELPLTGENVVITGSMSGPLAGRTRNEVRDLIEELGGQSSSAVSAKTTILVAGDGGGSKRSKVEEINVKRGTEGKHIVVLTESEFTAKINL